MTAKKGGALRKSQRPLEPVASGGGKHDELIPGGPRGTPPERLDAEQRPKRLRLTTDRTAWRAHVRDASALYREQAAQKLEARGKAIANDRRRVWAGREPELADVVHGPPLMNAREERTGRVFTTGDSVRFDELDAGTRRVVWDPRRQMHAFVAPVHVPEHTEQRGGTLPDQANWHFSRARSKREIFERVEDCGKTEKHKIAVVCRDCKYSQAIEVGCGSQWFCPQCRARAMSRIKKTFLSNRLGITTIARRVGLMRETDEEALARGRAWGRAPKRQRTPEGGWWGERFLTLTLPHRGDPVERIEVLNQTWTRCWRTMRDELRPKLQGRSGVRGEHIPRGVSARKADAMHPAQRHFRASLTHKKSKTLARHDTRETGDYELALFDLLSYFRVIEWTPGDDGKGHPHVHAWLFSQFLDQAWIERHWSAAWSHVQRERLHGGDHPKAGPIEEAKTIVHIEAAREGIERELVKYLTKDWEIDGSGGARRVAPEVFAQVYAYLDGKRRRQSSAGFSMWGVEPLKQCPCCAFEVERGSWCRVDITHALDAQQEWIGTYHKHGHYIDDEGKLQPMHVVNAGDAERQAAFDLERDASWQDDSRRFALAATMAPVLGVSVEWMATKAELRAPYDFEQVRFACEGEPGAREPESEQLTFEDL